MHRRSTSWVMACPCATKKMGLVHLELAQFPAEARRASEALVASPAIGSTGDQVFAKEFERALARQARGLRRVVLALVAIETVPRLVEEHRQFRMRPLNFFDFGRRDVLIFFAKMQHDVATRNLSRIFRNLSAVIAHSRMW